MQDCLSGPRLHWQRLFVSCILRGAICGISCLEFVIICAWLRMSCLLVFPWFDLCPFKGTSFLINAASFSAEKPRSCHNVEYQEPKRLQSLAAFDGSVLRILEFLAPIASCSMVIRFVFSRPTHKVGLPQAAPEKNPPSSASLHKQSQLCKCNQNTLISQLRELTTFIQLITCISRFVITHVNSRITTLNTYRPTTADISKYHVVSLNVPYNAHLALRLLSTRTEDETQ